MSEEGRAGLWICSQCDSSRTIPTCYSCGGALHREPPGEPSRWEDRLMVDTRREHEAAMVALRAEMVAEIEDLRAEKRMAGREVVRLTAEVQRLKGRMPQREDVKHSVCRAIDKLWTADGGM